MNRSTFGIFLNWMGLTGVGVEIGVMKGKNALDILSCWEGEKLFLIDNWESRPRYYQTVLDLFKDNKKVEVWKSGSADASKRFGIESLDWVYIDAWHDYKNLCTDNISWYNKVKKGGIIAGHDYRPDDSESLDKGTYGVKSAVDEFVKILKVDLHIIDEGKESTWYFIKE